MRTVFKASRILQFVSLLWDIYKRKFLLFCIATCTILLIAFYLTVANSQQIPRLTFFNRSPIFSFGLILFIMFSAFELLKNWNNDSSGIYLNLIPVSRHEIFLVLSSLILIILPLVFVALFSFVETPFLDHSNTLKYNLSSGPRDLSNYQTFISIMFKNNGDVNFIFFLFGIGYMLVNTYYFCLLKFKKYKLLFSTIVALGLISLLANLNHFNLLLPSGWMRQTDNSFLHNGDWILVEHGLITSKIFNPIHVGFNPPSVLLFIGSIVILLASFFSFKEIEIK